MQTCEACGAECPEGAAWCGSCGHQLGRPPEEPVVVNVRVVDSFWGDCTSCLASAIGVVMILALVVWIFGC